MSGAISRVSAPARTRADRDLTVAVLVAHALHGQGVGDDDALVAELPAQDAGQDRLAQRGRVAGRVQRRDHQVPAHDHVGAGPDGRAERWGVCLLPLRAGVRDDRYAGVAVGGRVAVAGEVLRRGDDPRVLLVAVDLRVHHRRDQCRVGGEGAGADHRVERVDVDVGVRRVVDVDAHRLELPAGDRGGGAGVGRAARGAEGHRAGELRGRRPDPGRPRPAPGRCRPSAGCARPSRWPRAAGRWTGR